MPTGNCRRRSPARREPLTAVKANFAGNGLDARLIPDPRLGLFDLSTKTKKRRGGASKALIRLTLDGNCVTNMNKRIRGVAQAPDGAVLLLVDGDDGELLRLTPRTRHDMS
ncbi:MAG: hypothetical protein JWP63_5897 [Candidatus Solibacter sp.]|nr:hypothetical protein [Candidatus Solibacter sp.]